MSYKICRKCVMNTSDPLITFDNDNVCNHCLDWEKSWAKKKELEDQWPDGLLKLIKMDKFLAHSYEFDAVLGLSGGIDSSYTYHLAKELGLKIYAIHFDNGYDLPEYGENLPKLLRFWGDELNVIKIDNEEFNRLQIAFLKSGTTGLEIPTDHAIKAITYQTARKMGIKNILNGTNIATESHGTRAWTEGHSDWKYIKLVAEKFGVKLHNLPHYNLLDMLTWMKNYNWISLLDYTYYDREKATQILEKKYGYKRYGFKHQESRITRFLHGYIIPRRFGWDTRRSRLSAMIMSGQITREEALYTLLRPAYDPSLIEEDRRIICSQIGISDEEFEEYMNLPLKHFTDYPSYQRDMKRIRGYSILRWAYHTFVMRR